MKPTAKPNRYSIYQKLWEKLDYHIKGKKTIYFAPTGQLNLLNHNALIMQNGKLFGDCYNLVRLSSTDKIINKEIAMDYIIIKCSKEDLNKLNNANISWYPCKLTKEDVHVTSEDAYFKALSVLERKWWNV